jgi:RsbT co-antagonist protein rsbRD N-terminal domain
MLGARLLQLLQAHAGSLTNDVMRDLKTNERTATFRRLKAADLEARVAALYWNLGKWIGNPDESAIREEYQETGRSRFREGVRISEMVYALLLTKQHLRRYIRDHGLVDFAGDRVLPDELLPLELHSIQELNYQVGEFFDRALYHLARGYELEAAGQSVDGSPRLEV